MQVILLEKLVNLGVLGDIVKVKDGYARNYLIPTGRAHRATAAAKAEFDARRWRTPSFTWWSRPQAQAHAEQLASATLKLTQKAGVDGRLFGSVTNFDIAEELHRQGVKVHKAQIHMPNGPIKAVGESTVTVVLHTDVSVELPVTVYGETA